jgi:hypothetical protein
MSGDRRFVCAECEETTAACVVCGRPMTVQGALCDRCVRREAEVVTDVYALATQAREEQALRSLPGSGGLRSASYNLTQARSSSTPPVPFGLAAGTDDLLELIQTAAAPGDVVARMCDPDNLLGVMREWAQEWADVLRDDEPADPCRYLCENLRRAAADPVRTRWADYTDCARTVRSALRRLVGETEVAEHAPCVHCRGRVVRSWGPKGLDDVRRCLRCHAFWPTEEKIRHVYANVVRYLPTARPDALVTLDDAKQIYRGSVSPKRLDLWAHRDRQDGGDRLPPQRGTDVRGRPVYRLGDFEDRLVTAPRAADA